MAFSVILPSCFRFLLPLPSETDAVLWRWNQKLEPLPFVAQVFPGTRACSRAVPVGNCLRVAAEDKSRQYIIYRYELVNNSWETLPHFLSSKHQINCLCAVHECIFTCSGSNLPQRYSLLKNNWQCGANLSFYNTSNSKKDKSQNVGAVVFE